MLKLETVLKLENSSWYARHRDDILSFFPRGVTARGPPPEGPMVCSHCNIPTPWFPTTYLHINAPPTHCTLPSPEHIYNTRRDLQMASKYRPLFPSFDQWCKVTPSVVPNQRMFGHNNTKGRGDLRDPGSQKGLDCVLFARDGSKRPDCPLHEKVRIISRVHGDRSRPTGCTRGKTLSLPVAICV